MTLARSIVCTRYASNLGLMKPFLFKGKQTSFSSPVIFQTFTLFIRKNSFTRLQFHQYSTTNILNQVRKPVSSKELTESPPQEGGNAISTSVKERVKENVKTSAYGSVVLIGIVVTGALAYLILSELFASDSPNNIYTKSFKLCKLSEEVQNVLGGPLKCYGEETRRGWRRHVAHQKFLIGDTKYIRMKFYIEGKFNKGTVYLEKKTNDQGQFEYSYLVVDVDAYPPRRINVDV